MKRLICTTILLSIFATPVRAEPGPIVNWLMDEPSSLFDMGMWRLDRQALISMKTVGVGLVGNRGFSTEYDWDSNRIRLNYFAINHPFNKTECKKTIMQARRVVGLVTDGVAALGHSYVANLFSHLGYSSNSAPKDYFQKLDNIIEITVTLDGGSCEGPLVSTDVLYRDK